jgi:ribosomal protein S18 acetylase RimI-like enzyme
VLETRPAEYADAPEILAVRHAAEDWLAGRSIDQWRPREVPLSTIDVQIARREFWVGLDSGTMGIVAAMRLIWSDRKIWHDDEKACYVHGLVIDRSRAGTGVGAAMLDHATDTARRAGVERLRLDCVESNVALRSYYRRLGFTEVGSRDFDDGWFSVTLFEKIV